MVEESDEALMLAYAGGNAEAFEALYARYRTPLYRYFLRHVSDAMTASRLRAASSGVTFRCPG